LSSIIESCRPRDGILQGTFNPEVFTASLSQGISHYRGRGGGIDNLYTDADQFFRDGTAPTDGTKFVLREALLRLSGDDSAPAIYRLETEFGGGKTHTLIALTHLAIQGNETPVDHGCAVRYPITGLRQRDSVRRPTPSAQGCRRPRHP
jgi:hypothetical protein